MLGFIPGSACWDLSLEVHGGISPWKNMMGYIPGNACWDISMEVHSGIST